MLEHGERVRQQTRHWDEGDSRTHTLRDKEDADDYRYFLEPDLVPVDPSPQWIDEMRARTADASRRAPPAARRRSAAIAPTSEAVASIVERGQDDYALAVVAAGGDAVAHGRAPQGGVRRARADARSCRRADLAAPDLLEVDGKLTATQAKSVLATLDRATAAATRRRSPPRWASRRWTPSALEAIVDEAIGAQPDAWAKYLAGEGKALGAIVGHVMKASKGQADGKLVNEILANARPLPPARSTSGNRTASGDVRFPLRSARVTRAYMVACSIR